MASNKLIKDSMRKSRLYTTQQINNMIHALARYKAEENLTVLQVTDLDMDSKLCHTFDHYIPSSFVSLLHFAKNRVEKELAQNIFASALKLNVLEDAEQFNKVS